MRLLWRLVHVLEHAAAAEFGNLAGRLSRKLDSRKRVPTGLRPGPATDPGDARRTHLLACASRLRLGRETGRPPLHFQPVCPIDAGIPDSAWQGVLRTDEANQLDACRQRAGLAGRCPIRLPRKSGGFWPVGLRGLAVAGSQVQVRRTRAAVCPQRRQNRQAGCMAAMAGSRRTVRSLGQLARIVSAGSSVAGVLRDCPSDRDRLENPKPEGRSERQNHATMVPSGGMGTGCFVSQPVRAEPDRGKHRDGPQRRTAGDARLVAFESLLTQRADVPGVDRIAGRRLPTQSPASGTGGSSAAFRFRPGRSAHGSGAGMVRDGPRFRAGSTLGRRGESTAARSHGESERAERKRRSPAHSSQLLVHLALRFNDILFVPLVADQLGVCWWNAQGNAETAGFG